ncbi:MAG: ankyrin repeat domain-containing protein [Saprospiraceae bacterium]|nr:ankyrin repeat domain-containing protein [Saprospiraceae bacterium]
MQQNYLDKIIIDLELHSLKGIRDCFENGVDPNTIFRDRPLIYELIGEYTRGPAFKQCVQLFIEYGLTIEDEVFIAVLSNNDTWLKKKLSENPQLLQKKYSFKCAYTSMVEASLLHICAEFNHLDSAKVLLEFGLEADVVAGYDEFGFGGQTPIFHTVNQNGNHSVDMLQYLLDQGANLQKTIAGVIWGKGYEWETLIPAVNPISYAMMGMLPQMHRDEKTIHSIVSLLLKRAYQIDYPVQNVPNAYLNRT